MFIFVYCLVVDARPGRVMVRQAENIWACSRIFRELRHQWIIRDICIKRKGFISVFVFPADIVTNILSVSYECKPRQRCQEVSLSDIMCQYVSRSGKYHSLILYLCIVNWVRHLRSVLVRCSIDLRSFSVPPSFFLRFSFVRSSLQKQRNIGETANKREIRIYSTVTNDNHPLRE